MSYALVNTRESREPQSFCVRSLLETSALQNPDATAIAAPGRKSLTYRGLWKQMEAVANALRTMGVARHDRVAIVLPQGPELATAFVAIAACATSVPLNPAYRLPEFDFCLENFRVNALLIQSGMDSPVRGVAQARAIPIIELVPQFEGAAGAFTLAGMEHAPSSHDGFARPEDVALMLHTSGTTSRPKSVPLTHANICASARSIAAALALTDMDRCLNIMPLFHIHGLIGGTLASLVAGASVVCPPGFYAPQFFDWTEELRPTWYTAVPTMHQAILRRFKESRDNGSRSSLRLIRSSSAPLPPKVLAELEDGFQVPVIEAYGMTEASHQIASNPLPPGRRKPGSVGLPTAPEIAIASEQGKFLPAGVSGEIWLRGATITQGYENNSEANRESFAGGWFRTGDCGYLDEEGYLFITGRLKEIINRGGEKISPREVDDVLTDHPAVAQAVTFSAPHPTLGEEIVAAIVPSGKELVTERAIQEFAATRLADFKVPRKILIVDEIPKNAAGKMQRMGLAERLSVKFSEPESGIEAHYTPPHTATEQKLAKIWSEVLRIDRVGVDDNFFALGGDSILASQVISRVNEVFHAELSFLAFFETATITAIAGRLENFAAILPIASSPDPETWAKAQSLPLSYAQERLWYLEQLEPGSDAYNRPTFFRLTGSLDMRALERGLDEIVQRHEILRTTFSSIKGRPYQNISPHRPLDMAFVNLCGLPASARDAEARRLAAEEAKKPFDLMRGPLLRATLLALGDEEHVLLLTIHHIAFDGWSQGVLLRELVALYQAFSAGKPSPLAPLKIQYADFANRQRRWLEGQTAATQLAYWKKQLKGSPPLLALPADRARTAVRTFQGAREPLVLSQTLSGSLKALSRQTEVSLFMTLLAAFQTLLFQATGQTDLSIGTFNANRNSVDTEGMIGFFVNNLVLRGDLSGNPTFRELLRRARQVCLGAYAHRDLPFEKLLEELQPKRSLSYSPLFQVMFVLQNTPQPPLELSGLRVQRYPAGERNRSTFDLTLELSEENEALTGHLEYSTDLFDAPTIRRMLQDFQTVLAAAVADPDRRLLSQSPAPNRAHASSARSATLAERRAKLSPQKQAWLTERLRGESADSSKRIDVPRHGTQTLIPTAVADRHSAPLSFAQQRLWFLDQLEPDTSLYNIPYAVRLKGSLNAGALRQALSTIVARHESLRTTFVSIHGDPVQRIAESTAFKLSVVDLAAWPEATREAEARRLLNSEASRPFDLSSDLMLRATLLRLSNDEHIFILVMHHIASDAWSIGILIREFAELYADFCAGRPSRLPELPIQYADFAVWQRQWLQGEILERQLAYWKHQLAALPVMALPTDRPRPPVQSYRGARRSLALSKSLSESLKSLSQRQGVSLFMTLLAAFQALLHRYTGQSDIVVGSPIAGRNRQETEGLIGFFVNTLVLRSDLSGDPTFLELLRRVRESTLDAYANQDLPFEKLVEELQPDRDPSRHPLFQALFALLNTSTDDMKMAGLTASPISIDRLTAKFDTSLSVFDSGRDLTLSLAYNTDLFDVATMNRLLGHFQFLLQGVVADPAQRLSALPILVAAEKRQLLVEWNDTKKDYPDNKSIHELFEAQVQRFSDAVAVVFENERLTYRELNQRANQLARYLLARGVTPGMPVAICMERSLEMVVGVLGILKAGGAYVPLDPAYPKERLAYILRDTRAALLLSQHHLAKELMEGLDRRHSIICLDSEWESVSSESEMSANPAGGATADDPAYIIYTSGSTGQPKGVEVTHRALVNFVTSTQEMLALEAGDRVLQFATLAFDTSAEEIFPCLAGGATLVLRTDATLDSVSLFLQRCRDWGITVLDLPTAYWHELVETLCREDLSLPQSLRLVIIGGEKAVPERLVQWQSSVGGRVRLLNTYGPTEGTVVSTMWELTEGDPLTAALLQEVPIGRPISNVQTYILDQRLNSTPVGVRGELHIGGDGLARGYLNRPDLTAEKFIPNPFSDQPGARLYKTGDLARYLPDGNIEFLGRIDHQVKIRGFRIELGEIESVLARHANVSKAVVIDKEVSGNRRLIGYIVPKEEDAPSWGELKEFLRNTVPEYMVPSAFVSLQSLPLMPNGKLDRKALPDPKDWSEGGGSADEYVSPRTAMEKCIAEVWQEVLGVDRVSAHDNFFDLGGHSLLSLKVIARIEEKTGQRVHPKEMILQTLGQIASLYEQKTSAIQEDPSERKAQKWLNRVMSLLKR